MAQGGRCTGGQYRGMRMRVTARRNDWNHGGDASECAAGEIWGKTAPTGGASLQ
jgi:hypothetical protein